MQNNDDTQIINKIRRRLAIMGRNNRRTTNFSLIEYFAVNNFQPINIKIIIMHLVDDYKQNPSKYVLSNETANFKNEKTFISSIKKAIKKNSAFVKGPGEEQLSLNLENTLVYLEAMYPKYANNSPDIKTPIKLSKRRIEKKQRHKNYDIKQEKKDDDYSQEMNNYRNKKENNYFFGNPQKYDYKKEYKYIDYKKADENTNEIFRIKDSDSDSYHHDYFFKDEIKKENYINDSERIPDIFNKDLLKNSLNSSLNINVIGDTVTYICDYLEDIEEFNNTMENKEFGDIQKLDEIKKNLVEMCDNKNVYDALNKEVKIWQQELYYIYQVMQDQLKAIKIEVNNKSYCYNAYIKLRDIILNYEAKYNTIMDSLFVGLNNLMDLDKKSVEKQLTIKKLLMNIYIKKEVFNSIVRAAKINYMNNHNFEKNRNSLADIQKIISDFQKEKMEIIQAVNDIDNDIGNISI